MSVLDLYTELRRIAEALDAGGIPYALAGGLAVSIYTTPRATEDIDLLIARGDLDRAVSALQPAGFRPAGRPMPVAGGRLVSALQPAGFRPAGRPMPVAGGRLEIQRLTKIEGTDLLPLDLLIPTDPALTALIADRASLSVEGRQVQVIGLAALRTLKRLRGSALDRADLEALGPE
ncbi:MAG: nucleotidyltransferase family protein [Candidatus Rokubacteria bacterium]|nr:nucleotidyltransferase family protein [Candidatus Rokubacteria bacterium]